MTGFRRWWYGQYVTDSQADDAVIQPRYDVQALAGDHALIGITHGLTAGERYVGSVLSQNLSVDVAAGVCYLLAGQRVPLDVATNIDVSVDYLGASTAVTAGYHRCVSVFATYTDAESEPHARKSGPPDVNRVHTDSCTLVVRQGTETLLASPLDRPALDTSSRILLADVTLINGQTQVLTGDIDMTTRRDDAIVLSGTPYSIRRGYHHLVSSDLLGWLNGHLSGAADRHDGADVDLAAIAGTPVATDPDTLQTITENIVGAINDHITGADTPLQHAAAKVLYSGSGIWCDGTAITGANVEAALDEVVSNLTSRTLDYSGADKMGSCVASGSPLSLPSNSIQQQFIALLGWLNNHISGTTTAYKHYANKIRNAAYSNAANYPFLELAASDVQAQLEYLFDVVHTMHDCCRVTMSSQTIPTGVAWTALTFNTEDYDWAELHSGTYQSRFVATNNKGTFAINAGMTISGLGADWDMIIVRHSDGAWMASSGGVSGTYAVNIAGTVELAAGDYCEIMVRHSAGGDKLPINIWAEMHRIGAGPV